MGAPISFSNLCSVLFQEAKGYAAAKAKDGVKDAINKAQKATSYVATKAKKAFPGTTDKVEKFANSQAGRALLTAVKSVGAETAGMMVGNAYSTQTAAYFMGKKVADSFIADSPDKAASQKKKLIVQAAGVAAALTVTATTTALSYLTTGDSTSGQLALGCMVNYAGTIMGGMEGLAAVGATPLPTKDVVDSHPVRAFQYLAAQGAVQAVRGLVDPLIPAPLRPITGIVGGTAKALAGTGGFYARELARMVDRYQHRTLSKKDFRDPGEFLTGVLNAAFGSPGMMVQSLLGEYEFIPFLGMVAQRTLTRIVDEKAATNALVRALNHYMLILQKPEIRQASQKLVDCPQQEISQRNQLQKKLMDLINHEIYRQFSIDEKGLAYILQLKSSDAIRNIVQSLIAQMKEGQVKMVGFEFMNPESAKEHLEVHILSLMSIALIALKKETATALAHKKAAPLKTDEIENFYTNLNDMLFSFAGDSIVAGSAKAIVREAIDWGLNIAQGPLHFAAQEIGTKIAEVMNTPSGAVIEAKKAEVSVAPARESRHVKFLNFVAAIKGHIVALWKDFIDMFAEFKREKKASQVKGHAVTLWSDFVDMFSVFKRKKNVSHVDPTPPPVKKPGVSDVD